MGFDRPGLELGMFPADADFSDDKHQFTAVWLGVGKNPTTLVGNTAVLKKSAPADSDSGSAPAGGAGSTPAPKQQDSFAIADGSLADGQAYGFKINGEQVSHTAATGEDAEAVLTALGSAAQAAGPVSPQVSAADSKTTLKLTGTGDAAVTYSDIIGVTHTEDVPAPTAGSGSGTGDADADAGELKGGPIGILQNTPGQGMAANVLISGISMVRAGGAWAAGDNLGVDDEGAVVKATSGNILGLAVESAVEGDVSSILLLPRSAA